MRVQKGFAHPLLLIAGVGILAFFAVITLAPSGNNFLTTLNPKPESQAAGNGVMFGAWVGNGVNVFGDMYGFEAIIGKVPKVRHIYCSNCSDSQCSPTVNTQLPDVQTDPLRYTQYLQVRPLRNGEIMLLSWTPDDNIHPDHNDFAKIESGVTDETLNAFIDAWAKEISKSPNEIWLNPFWEINACHGWNDWWCAPKVGNQRFKNVYNKIIAKFKERFAVYGKTNVKYVWNVDKNNNSAIAAAYPGDTHVDIISFDAYPASKLSYQATYDIVTAVSPTKDIIVQETSLTTIFDANSITTILSGLPGWFPRIKALVWFDESISNLSGQLYKGNAAYQLAFKNGVANYIGADDSVGGSSPSPSPAVSASVLPSPSPSLLPSPSPSKIPSPSPSPSPSNVPSPSPVVSPSPAASSGGGGAGAASAPTITPIVSCINSNTTTPAVNISWTNPSKPVLSVHISNENDFFPRWDKSVTGTSTTAPDGYTPLSSSGAFLLQPNTTYYVRLYNFYYSPVSTFSIPPCGPTSSPSSAPTKPGDLDGDGKVGIFDFNILLGNFGKTGSGIQGDLDGDSKVGIFDFNILLGNFGK